MTPGVLGNGNGSMPTLQIYLLGEVPFENALSLQRRLVYDAVGGEGPSLILCEHPPILTVGRHGSHAHLHLDGRLDGLGSPTSWEIRWVNRGGGCWLQVPGQLAVYPIMPLQRLGMPLRTYLRTLQTVIQALLADFDIKTTVKPGKPEIWAGDRPIACVGIAVRNWVTYYGAILNINPDLPLFRMVKSGQDHEPMTSLERERRGPVRPSLIRERLLEHFISHFGLTRTVVFSEHPLLSRKAPVHALPAAY